MGFILNIHSFMKRQKAWQFVIIITLLIFLISLLLGLILTVFKINIGNTGGFEPKSISDVIDIFVPVCIFAPLLETFLSQFIVIKVLRKISFVKNKDMLIAIVSALIFAIGHTYSWLYILNTFTSGLVLSYSFILYEKKNEHPFWIVCSIHFLKNFINLLGYIIGFSI